MKIYISFDFEGINGVSRFSQVEKRGGKSYDLALTQAYKEIEAVVKGAFSAEIEAITINDAHSSMTNLDAGFIDDRMSLITGKPKNISMMVGLDSSYHAAILLGYHAKSGAAGACLAHTFMSDLISVKVNGVEAGEAYLNSLYASTLNVPVALITGDEALKEEIYNHIGDIPFVVSKRAIAFNAVECRPNGKFLKELEEATMKSLKNPTNWILNRVESPYDLEVEFSKAVIADMVELMPGIERISSRKVSFRHPKFDTVYRSLQAMCIMAGSSDIYN